MALSEWLTASQIFNNVAVGVAALAGASLGVPAIKRWYNIRSLRRQYPPSQYGKKWELIALEGAAPIYVHDLETNTRRHIANPSTMIDAGFDWNSVRRVSRDGLENITLGPNIDTERKL